MPTDPAGTFSLGTRCRGAAIDGSTGNVTGWNPNAGPGVRALAVSGSTVYVGGEFTQVGGVSRSHLAAIDATTGTTVWKARHERSNSYMFVKPSLKDIAKELADEMIKYMPPQAKG